MLDFNLVFIYYFICHTIITKNKGKEREKKMKWRGDLTETIGAYERLLAFSSVKGRGDLIMQVD